MNGFKTIEIDFDIHKKIELERRSFSEPQYIALRRLLGLPEPHDSGEGSPTVVATANGRAWSGKRVTLPHGTKVRMLYNDRLHNGQILDGFWVIEGRKYTSPSGAAGGVAVTKAGGKTRLDGWIYWEAQIPGETNWVPIEKLRPDKRHISLEDF